MQAGQAGLEGSFWTLVEGGQQSKPLGDTCLLRQPVLRGAFPPGPTPRQQAPSHQSDTNRPPVTTHSPHTPSALLQPMCAPLTKPPGPPDAPASAALVHQGHPPPPLPAHLDTGIGPGGGHCLQPDTPLVEASIPAASRAGRGFAEGVGWGWGGGGWSGLGRRSRPHLRACWTAGRRWVPRRLPQHPPCVLSEHYQQRQQSGEQRVGHDAALCRAGWDGVGVVVCVTVCVSVCV